MKDLPKGIALTVFDENYRESPYPIYKRIREQARLHYDDELNQHIAIHHHDVKSVLRNKDMWLDPCKDNLGTYTYELLGGNDPDNEPSILLMDNPDHKRLRFG